VARTRLFTILLFAFLPWAAYAADAPVLATLMPPGMAIARGDLLRTTRVYGAWSLNCEIQISTENHICAVEQGILFDGRPGLNWSLALGSDNQPVLVIWIAEAKEENEIKVSAGELALVRKPTSCDQMGCQVLMSFDASLQAAVFKQKNITFQVTSAGKEITAAGVIDGLSDALIAAAEDPIGLKALAAPPADDDDQPK
jgi:invasion protein IalB